MKRANGSGSIVKLSGNRRRPYMVRVSARDEYGHIVQRALSYHEKAADAQAALDEYNRNRLEGKAPTADRMNATLAAGLRRLECPHLSQTESEEHRRAQFRVE